MSSANLIRRTELEADFLCYASDAADFERCLRINRLKAGEALTELRSLFAHGEWLKYSSELYKRAKISRKTAERYVTAYKEVCRLGPAIVAAAREAGLDLEKADVRALLIKIRMAEDPDAPPAKIVDLTNSELEEQRKQREEDARWQQEKQGRHRQRRKWRKSFADAFDAEFEREALRRPTGISPELLKYAREIVESGYREQAKKAHPDRGGAHEAMLLVNSAVVLLRDFLEEKSGLTQAA